MSSDTWQFRTNQDHLGEGTREREREREIYIYIYIYERADFCRCPEITVYGFASLTKSGVEVFLLKSSEIQGPPRIFLWIPLDFQELARIFLCFSWIFLASPVWHHLFLMFSLISLGLPAARLYRENVCKSYKIPVACARGSTVCGGGARPAAAPALREQFLNMRRVCADRCPTTACGGLFFQWKSCQVQKMHTAKGICAEICATYIYIYMRFQHQISWYAPGLAPHIYIYMYVVSQVPSLFLL